MTNVLTTDLDALVSLVGNSQLLGDLVVISRDCSQLLLNLSFAARQVHVDDCQLIDAGLRFFVSLFYGAFTTKSLKIYLY